MQTNIDMRAVFFCSNYNGRQVYFWMGKKDAADRNATMGGDYKLICEGKKQGDVVTGANGKSYQFFRDYSLRPI